jgi:hypothetical protein
VLIIRQAQLDILDQKATAEFESELVRFVHQHFPAAAPSLGEEGVRAAIRASIERAAAYGVRTRRDQSRWIALAFTFGMDFDRRLNWAKDILDDPALTPLAYKMDLLYAEAARHVQ